MHLLLPRCSVSVIALMSAVSPYVGCWSSLFRCAFPSFELRHVDIQLLSRSRPFCKISEVPCVAFVAAEMLCFRDFPDVCRLSIS